jgi:hypothetical protein
VNVQISSYHDQIQSDGCGGPGDQLGLLSVDHRKKWVCEEISVNKLSMVNLIEKRCIF